MDLASSSHDLRSATATEHGAPSATAPEHGSRLMSPTTWQQEALSMLEARFNGAIEDAHHHDGRHPLHLKTGGQSFSHILSALGRACRGLLRTTFEERPTDDAAGKVREAVAMLKQKLHSQCSAESASACIEQIKALLEANKEEFKWELIGHAAEQVMLQARERHNEAAAQKADAAASLKSLRHAHSETHHAPPAKRPRHSPMIPPPPDSWR